MHTTHSRNANQRRVIRNFVSPCPEGTRIYQKPTASSEGAQLWDRHHLILSWFRKAGPTIILNIIRDASVHLRGTIYRWRYLMYPQLILNQLAVQGCVATARRHSLLCLCCKPVLSIQNFLCASHHSVRALVPSDVRPHSIWYERSYHKVYWQYNEQANN